MTLGLLSLAAAALVSVGAAQAPSPRPTTMAHRSTVYAPHAMIATSPPVATVAGLAVLERGGKGAGGDSMVKRVYGHLGTVRHRAEAVEYRVEQHMKTLGERLTALQPTPAFVTTSVTTSKSAV